MEENEKRILPTIIAGIYVFLILLILGILYILPDILKIFILFPAAGISMLLSFFAIGLFFWALIKGIRLLKIGYIKHGWINIIAAIVVAVVIVFQFFRLGFIFFISDI